MTRLKGQLTHWAPLVAKLSQGPDVEAALIASLEAKCQVGGGGAGAGGEEGDSASPKAALAAFVAPHFARILKLVRSRGYTCVV